MRKGKCPYCKKDLRVLDGRVVAHQYPFHIWQFGKAKQAVEYRDCPMSGHLVSEATRKVKPEQMELPW